MSTTLKEQEKKAAILCLTSDESILPEEKILGKKILSKYTIEFDLEQLEPWHTAIFTPRRMPSSGHCGTEVPVDNEELRKMAKHALSNWLFNDDDPDIDPDGHIEAGLEYLASEGDYVPDEDVPGLFENPAPGENVWDVLTEIAKGIGSDQGR